MRLQEVLLNVKMCLRFAAIQLKLLSTGFMSFVTQTKVILTTGEHIQIK